MLPILLLRKAIKRLDTINNVTRRFFHNPSHIPTDVLMIQLLGRRELHVSMQLDLWQLIWGLCLNLRQYMDIYGVYVSVYNVTSKKPGPNEPPMQNFPKTWEDNILALTKWMFLIDMS